LGDGKEDWIKNSHSLRSERSSKLRDYNTMMVPGVPDIRVLEPVYVHLEPAIRVEVHVGNKNVRRAISAAIL
jgi:hypothetical protein